MRSRAWVKTAPLFVALAGLCALLAASSGADAAKGPSPDHPNRGVAEAHGGTRDDTLIVRFNSNVPPGQAKKLLDDLGATVTKVRGRSKLEVIQFPSGTDLNSKLDALRASGLIDVAGFDYIATAFDAPNDPDYADQWHLHDTTGGIWAESAWDLAPSAGAGVTVAVIDTGAAFETYDTSILGYFPQHFEPAPDLAGIPIVAPWNFLTDTPHANDDHGHGTHVSGTIVQATNNNRGVAGVAHGASLMPLKVLDYSGSGSTADLVEAIYYATDNGARVINMSLGFSGTGEPDAYGQVCAELPGLNDALDYAFGHGVTVVAASGNESATAVSCPAAYYKVIAVGATRYDGTKSWFSNTGFALDVTAPGGDPNVDQDANGQPDGVLQQTYCLDSFTMLLTGDYTQFCSVYMPGTSMASPHVAGTAALLLGANPSLTPLQVEYYLKTTARDRGAAGRDDSYGWGAIDAHAALAALQGGTPPIITPTPPPPPPSGTGPAAPTALTATGVSASSISLTWQDNASDEAGYKVERRPSGGEFAQVGVLGANVTSWTNTGLTAGTTYDFRVRAYNAMGNSYYSNTTSGTTFPPPAAPSNLTAAALSTDSIGLSWTDNSTSEQGFRIERSTDGVSFLVLTNTAANATSYTSLYLQAGVTYWYRVRAFDGSGSSGWSNVASTTTFPPPAAPTNLVATAASSSSISLTWTDNATTETNYKVERSTDGVSFFQVVQIGANSTSYTNLYLNPGTTYWYRVKHQGLASSAYSNVASAATFPPPAAPSNLTATALSGTSIRLDWTDNSSSEAGFKVERSTDGSSFLQVATVGANVATYTNNYLSAGQAYWYRVRAYEGSANSDYSNVATNSTLPPPAAPSNLAATAVSNSSIQLTWTDNSSTEGGFKIERSTNGTNFLYVGSAPLNVTS
jgi:subtilisin family serine protease